MFPRRSSRKVAIRHSYLQFLKDLKSLLAAGAPIKEALSSLALRARPNSYADQLCRAVGVGSSLGEAMGHLVPPVPAEHAAMVTAGEASGKLVEVLEMVLREVETRREYRRALLSQVAYPLTMLLLVAILPPIFLIFAGKTQAYVTIQLAVFLPLALVLLGMWWGPRWMPPGSALRERVERFLLGLPGLRRVILNAVLGRTLHLLGMLLEAGLGFAESLPLAGRAAGWVVVRRDLARIDRELRAGRTATESLAGLTGLPANLLARIARGEQEGMLGCAFLDVGEELRGSYLRFLKVTLRVVPVVALLAAALLVLLLGLQVIAVRYDGLGGQ